jgi:cephalosporin hydroxylase/glycosyltransferase involved in cell wall biosynthesis
MVDPRSGEPVRIEGFLDGVTVGRVRGWAWLPEHPSEAAVISLSEVSGESVASDVAAQFRADLQAAGKRGGYCGFDIALPAGASGRLRLRARHPSGDHDGLLLGEVELDADAEALPSFVASEQGPTIVGHLDQASAQEISGWCYAGEPFDTPLTLQLVEGDQVLATAVADRWRNDLEDFRQGDGRVGLVIAPPDSLYDGAVHRLELRLPGGAGLTATPFAIHFPSEAPTPRKTPAVVRPPRFARPVISIIVNFYNMEREAARTLLSLSRRFQRGVEKIPYEVICIDNGSNPPLSEAFVASFGPEFRLVRPKTLRPSPCAALNEAVAQARGRWLALMIDGAHLLSPGALRKAHDALKVDPGGIVALRQWFIGGDQRWFSSVGYSRAHEDALFARIDWPNEGYKIFEIGSPMFESPNTWFDGLSESNCLFVPARLYRRIGGFDEAFNMPGAGYANLDLFRRAAAAADAVICLVGEASFHQYHGGVTTNINDAEKDRRVRTYANHYEQVRGEGFVNIAASNIKLVGTIETTAALGGRQRGFCPAHVGLTTIVRPRAQSMQFDEQSQKYLQSAYVETGRHLTTRWGGFEVGVAPSDLTDIQEAVWRVRPDVVVMREASPGLVHFVASILPSLGLDETRLLWLSDTPEAVTGLNNVQVISSRSGEAQLVERAREAIGDAEHVLVLYQPSPHEALPVENLELHADLVTFGSYLIVVGAALGQPWLGYSRQWLYRAIQRFVQGQSSFVIDRTMNQHFVTTCPSGFLRRVLNPFVFEDYDAALDDLSRL